MTLTFSINENNDIYLDASGNIAMSTGLEAVKNICQNAAQTRFGEMIYATNEGLPFFETLWNGKPNTSQFEAALRNTLLQVADVKQVISVATQIRDNTLIYRAIILTIYGQTFIDGSI